MKKGLPWSVSGSVFAEVDLAEPLSCMKAEGCLNFEVGIEEPFELDLASLSLCVAAGITQDSDFG